MDVKYVRPNRTQRLRPKWMTNQSQINKKVGEIKEKERKWSISPSRSALDVVLGLGKRLTYVPANIRFSPFLDANHYWSWVRKKDWLRGISPPFNSPTSCLITLPLKQMIISFYTLLNKRPFDYTRKRKQMILPEQSGLSISTNKQ